jgi:hypothetical protein
VTQQVAAWPVATRSSRLTVPLRLSWKVDRALVPASVRALGVQDGVGLVVDDGADQGLLVLEVVIHLRAAHPGRRPDVLQRRLGHAALEDELRRGRDDPLTARSSTSTAAATRPSGQGAAACNVCRLPWTMS